MFLIHKSDTGAVAPFEYLPAAAGTYQIGQLLNVSDGTLQPISAACTTKPAYLCVGNATVAAGGNVAVVRVSDDTIYETSLSAAAAGAVVGGKLQISAGGLQADGAADGSFEVVYAEGTAQGSIVRGRFV